ncbi:MAG: Thiamine-phosphate pyrophosphorylase [uncultured Aureispira sp.]|uniref:Thiamine-phosphate pyrophosphorylase n=1 Tax=uncultured Aureispira sp. TaxID=1331704 RepID=A0A6S6TER3_9BACT|nr:MAG: Thiamine-phosphate pyrophosphorylase [uncultured Aureispira sp.]
MKHRVYTLPNFFEGEAALINQLFEEGLPCLHLRKEQQSIHPFIDLLVQIESKHYSKIIVHQYPELVGMFQLLGLHLTESARRALSAEELQHLIIEQHNNQRQIGTSIHQKIDLDRLPKTLDYCTVSPVFSSISKQNHAPTVHWQASNLAFPFTLVALGGMSVQTLEACAQRGFQEVAFLGAVWNDLSNVLQNYRLLCKKMNALTP